MTFEFKIEGQNSYVIHQVMVRNAQTFSTRLTISWSGPIDSQPFVLPHARLPVNGHSTLC